MSKCVYLTCVLATGPMILSAQTAPALPAVQTTAMVGLAQGQTAQLNLLNPGIPASATGAVGVICSATVSFVDANGAVLKVAPLSIPPGKSMALDLRSDTDLSIAYGVRREIRALVATPGLTPVVSSSAAALPACKLIPSLEIFDTASGRTLVTLGHLTTISAATPAN